MMFLMPLSGYVSSTLKGHPTKILGTPLPMLFEKNKELAGAVFNVHVIASYLCALFILMHIGAALKHHFINKDNILKRMLPFSG